MNFYRRVNFFAVFFSFLILLLSSIHILAQAGKGSSGSGSSQNSSGGSSSKGQSAGSSASDQASAGISGGTIAIESTLFAYKSLSADAQHISEKLSPVVRNQVVLIATPNDLTNFAQWRAVMAQADLLHQRAQNTLGSAKAITAPSSFVNVPKNVQTSGGAFIASPSDVQALIQTVASIFAVNHTLAPSAGALTSTPFTNLLAGRLRSSGATVYCPSAYPPNLFRRNSLQDTFISAKLSTLEDDRKNAVAESQRISQILADAATILSAAAGTSYATPAAKEDAARVKANEAGIQVQIAALASVTAAIDGFETTLFSGQAAPASATASKTKNTAATDAQNGVPPAAVPIKPLGDAQPNPAPKPADDSSASNGSKDSGTPSP